eukprot:CAMPEP_0113947258 /NCGR_PEP_ID=MMETSP1339-20121228/63461_1 /TAXON_ID=94617 /ORGANISM="Fibrocapsa japonica" /LENGTH=108 /DNA_ID=CAMNT_0000953749 /DNA_START=133 /DNA_END=455 /DNA_ORIENTATION=+ /assembly_acc=CAM_ASM_000762
MVGGKSGRDLLLVVILAVLTNRPLHAFLSGPKAAPPAVVSYHQSCGSPSATRHHSPPRCLTTSLQGGRGQEASGEDSIVDTCLVAVEEDGCCAWDQSTGAGAGAAAAA